MSQLKAADYWIHASKRSGLDPDQVASQNYSLPTRVHQDIRVRQVCYLEQILHQLPEPRHVLDLGCGPGVWALQLAHMVDSWLGYDIAPKFIEKAREDATRSSHAHLRFEVGSMLEVEEGQRFNVVVLGGIMGYLEDSELPLLMSKVAAHLQPGGVVYARVSVSPGIYPRITLMRSYPIHYRKAAHYEGLFREAGFRVTRERDYAFSEASLATAYTALARWCGRTGMTAYRVAQRLRPLSFGLARRLLDLTPLPQSVQFLLRR